MTSSLLPDLHPVPDFFVLDVLDVVPRTDMASMEHPIFSLATRADQRTLVYEHNNNKLEIIPSSIGLPTVMDKDILIYCISKLVHQKNKQPNVKISPTVRFTTHDMLVQTNRPTNNLGYERLLPALNRLRGVVLNTTIKTGGSMTTRGFGLIDSFEYNRRGSMFADRLQYLEITLSDWLFRAIDKIEVLPISRDYFRLRRPIDRRLYELARKHCGSQPSWRIGVDLLQKKCGSHQAAKHFTAHLRGVTRSNHLPEYAMTLEDGKAVFFRRGRNGTGLAQVADKPKQVLSGPRQILVSTSAIDRLADLVPGWDKYMLEHAYYGWASDKESAHNEDARFLAWVKTYTGGKPYPR